MKVSLPIAGSAAPAAEKHYSRMVERSPVYYGWVVLFVGTLGLAMTTPGQTVGVSLFFDRIVADLQLTRSSVSLMYTLGTLGGALMLPFVGRFVDRRGPRFAVIVIAAGFALACLWMGIVQGIVSLLLGFWLIRGLGQGSLSLVSVHVINLWFIKRRGLAIGISGLGMATASALFPLFIEMLINRYDWRTAYMLLGAMVALSILPLGALFFRHQPEHYGLLPDGRSSPIRPNGYQQDSGERNYSAAEARRSITFWLFIAGGFCVAAFTTALVLHHTSIMASHGLDVSIAIRMFVPLGFMVAASNFATSALSDIVPPRFLLSLMLVLLCGCLLLAGWVNGLMLMLLYGVLLGATQGMNSALQGVVYAHYFGRAFLGSIRGFAATITTAGTAFGPLLFALAFEASGSYLAVLLFSTLPPLAIALAAPFIRPPSA